jgi:hypothetical protein
VIKQYTLLFLICCSTFLLIPIDKPLDAYHLLMMVLFSSGITLKAWSVFKQR